MNKDNYTSIDYDWLTKPTGDPFANAGGYALKVFSETFPDDDILQLISRATDIYVDKWDSNLYALFPNSNVTQTNSKFQNRDYKKSQALKGFKDILNLVDGKDGCCRITGRKTKVFCAGKHNYVLAGSKSMTNFHHYFEDGMMVSAEILIRLFFLPFAVKTISGNNCLIGSSDFEVEEEIARQICKNNFTDISHGCSVGVLKCLSSTPSTEIFRVADDILKTFGDKNLSLQMYLFKNAARETAFEKYTLPFEGMDFYRFVNKVKYKDDWKQFINTRYFFYDKKDKKNIYNTSDSNFEEEQFKYWKNSVYEDFLKGKSIIPEILKWSKNNVLNFDIVKFYEIKVRKMKKETISKIEQMADFIFEANTDKFSIKKAITKLYAVDSSYDLRRFVLKDIVAKYYEKHAEEEQAIITVNDYTNYLFPDTDSWKETRDVLIIALFQKLHEKNMKIDIEEEQQEN
ncbi:MAG: hypothetical protein J5554_02580 [Paludibacteraceae bacterium]|nr:hypothetical protein [Paludibacteraceae bacterium]